MRLMAQAEAWVCLQLLPQSRRRHTCPSHSPEGRVWSGQGFGGLSARGTSGSERRMGWGPGMAPIRDELRDQSFSREQLQGTEDSSVAGMEASKPFCSTSSTPRTQEGQEGRRTPFLLTTQPRPGQECGAENDPAVKESCV